MSTNLERGARAAQCLDRYRELAGELSPEESVTDLVADIGHYCTANDLTYLHLLAHGISHWRLEMTDPDSIDLPPDVSIIINEG